MVQKILHGYRNDVPWNADVGL